MTTTTDLRLFIGAQDYGPLGANIVTALSTGAGGPDVIGQAATALEAAGGGGYTILNRQEVAAYQWTSTNHNPSVGHISKIYFGGFVNLYQASRPAGTNQKQWRLGLQDYNVLKTRLVSRAAPASAIDLAAGTMAAQFIALQTALTGVSKTIDMTTYVLNLTGATVLPAQHFTGKNLDHMIQAIFAAALVVDPTLAPRAVLAPDYAVGGARTLFGGACLYVWDANAPPSAIMTLSDATAGDVLAESGYERTLDATDQVTARDSVRPSNGYVATYLDAAAVALWPNPYDPAGAWWEEPLTDGESASNAAADARIQAWVETVSSPRETVALSTQKGPPPLPSQYIDLSLALEGITSELYQVGGQGVDFMTIVAGGVASLLETSRLNLGLPRLGLGQDPGALGGGGIPQTAVPPAPPGTPTASSNAFDPLTGNTAITYAWAAPSHITGVTGYRVTVTAGGVPYYHQVAGAGTLSYADRVNAGQALTVTVASYNAANGLYSVESAPLSVTAASAYAPDAPTGLSILSTGPEAHNKGWAIIGFTPPGTTHGPHDQYEARVIGGGQTWSPLRFPGTNTQVEISGFTLEVAYTVELRTLSNPTWYGAYNVTPLAVTVHAQEPPPVAAGGGLAAKDAPIWPFFKTAGTGTPTLDTSDPYEGAAAYKFVSTGADTQTLTEARFATVAGQVWTVRTAAKKSGGSPTLTGTVEWDDGTDTWALTTSTLTLPALTTSWPSAYTEQQVKAPSSALFGRLKYSAAFVAALTILLSAPPPTPAKGPADLHLPLLEFRDPTTNAVLNKLTLDTGTGTIKQTNEYSTTDTTFEVDATDATAILGHSVTGAGVRGESTDGNGLEGVSVTNNGATGQSTDQAGAYGVSVNGPGVLGQSVAGPSGRFQSASGSNTTATVIILQTGSSTANLLEFRDSSGTLLSHVDYLGVWHTP